MFLARSSLTLTIVLTLLSLPALALAQDISVSQEEHVSPSTPYSPYPNDYYPQNVYFGDTHLHTAWSADAGMAGATPGPEVAYRAARGEVVESQTAGPFKLVRPHDFVVVADHAENMGLSDYLNRGDPKVLKTEGGRRWYEMVKAGNGYDAFIEWIAANGRGEDQIDSPEMVAEVWEKVIENADRYYQPGVFTTFIGYEWTSGPDGNNLHRNVIFRDGGDRARQVVPFSALDSDNPEDLWAYMRAYEEETGGQVLAIPHNGNLSNGMMFMLETFAGEPFSEEYARTRAEFEPVVEVTQPKGTGEAHPFLSPDDAFADFEIIDASNLNGTTPKTPEMIRTEYARQALKDGLAEEARLGVNPFKFGMIGATDAHNALPSTREENWFGKAYIVEPSPHRRDGVLIESTVDPQYSIYDIDLGASGLAAVWATENTREAIWDAFARKEVFATTGTRLRVRVFGGWDFEAAEVSRADFARAGYARGVPMGGDLRPGPDGAAPTFMIRALRDPDGANLDRIQVIKGWLNANGETQERIWDIACANREIVDGACGGEVGSTVNVADASWTNTIGSAALAGFWEDPEFDPGLKAFYYVRVLEIPTPRWTAYDAKFFDIDMPEGTPMTVQDRAYTSPIWYTPRN
ncbi:DUF3604 domain-containing protein [Defluviimonas sp. D31]|uniref:DUF3604 domain-containing protein n=1 Tax=Defluviimonas sp. D31 TaxID=3083253 RepID=UPI00296E51B5|nr:DUF3604 domain-containing protein [Defluviimonas sp. D31]MDW4551500.1 DUF3604 domain-containing protein [Defluviimonas sp. D31]